MTIMTN